MDEEKIEQRIGALERMSKLLLVLAILSLTGTLAAMALVLVLLLIC
jgi:hypothetical protein